LAAGFSEVRPGQATCYALFWQDELIGTSTGASLRWMRSLATSQFSRSSPLMSGSI